MQARSKLLGLAGAVAALAALPASAVAADTTSTVSGVVGTELSLSVAAPAAMTFTPSTDGTASSLVSVVSTQPSWTLSIRDAGGTTPGFLDKVLPSAGGSLSSPLEWRLSGGSTWNALSGTAATVTTGSLVQSQVVEYRQQVDAAEDVAAGDTYSLVATYTVT
jgi:hypothetical protein